MTPIIRTILILTACVGLAWAPVPACTNFIVTKGASADGSVMITYSADSHTLYGQLNFIPGGRHIEGSLIDVIDDDSQKYVGKIRQVAETFTVVGLMNEHQVAIGETTYGGREELVDPKGGIDYTSLMNVALQRARTAREAVRIMGALVAEYGYFSSGETFSISDPQEAWIMDMIGKGKENKGAVWVALRVPDGYVCAHANQARIRQFPLNDPENCLYAPDVISFAREKGYFKGEDKDFSFADTYAPLDFGALRACEARVWSFFRRVAPSLNLPIDYVKGIPGATPLPLWIKPDQKLSVRDLMELMRDHFEGTEFDLSVGVGAGPYKLPYRWRPMTFEVDGVKYVNERSVGTQQTGFSFVAQSRSWLPGPIGGIFWFGVDDTASTVYTPMYCGLRAVPTSFAAGTGDFNAFSWDSAFWVFNFVSNYTYSRYCDMIQDVQTVQRELEGAFIAQVPEVDKAALALHQQSPELAREYLTRYSVDQGEMVVRRWRKLGEFLIWKYLDGNVRDSQGNVTHPGYPADWYRRIAEERGEVLKVRPLPGEKSSH
ncbi:MAG TPA: C69 family dipeptidase [Acidobacteriota bacterium]|nr:C69 family dipeptidase [Acidobacteriota bacterium]HNU02026.1 C69 family dipeptidase [Acidobacteriota bacterium]HPB29199.1 C69 family dipeptidase [Acidobacteriota bacterium]HQO26099.1 C69 family dipeptidase [Acidobacteriota bacterium]HQP74927.1 C69 family dipeptidase [Acidobacteriota bacterium]